MAPKRKKKNNKRGLKLYYCEWCKKKKHDDVVACDVCEKWFHFQCMKLESIGKEENWICPNCKKDDSLSQGEPGSQQTVNTASDDESLISSTVRSTENPDNISVTNTSIRNRKHDQQQQSVHSLDAHSRVSVVSSNTRQQIELAKLEEERELERKYLEKKYKVLLSNCKKNSVSQFSSRASYTKDWIDSQNQTKTKSTTSIWKDDNER